MITDHHSELNSPINDQRLPSLLALRCFEAAARLENFTRAAEELHLTHGAVSRAVRMLEDDLGVPLFERRSRRVFLTEGGRQLARAVSDGFGLMRDTVRELRAGARRSRQWVLSCEPTLLMRWLIPRWPDFQRRHPELNIHLVAGGGPFSFADGIDLAIRRDDFAWPASVHAETLFAEQVGPVCRPDRISATFTPRTLQPRAGAPRLHSKTRPDAWRTWAALTSAGLPKAPEQIFDHFYFSLQAAVAGLGAAIGPWQLVRDDIAAGVLAAPLGFVEDGSRYCLLAPTPIIIDSAQHALLTWLRDQA